MSAKLQQFLDSIENALQKVDNTTVASQEAGIVQSYKDGVIAVRGLKQVPMGAILGIEGSTSRALVMNLEKDMVYAVVLTTDEQLKEGLVAQVISNQLHMEASDKLLGMVIDSLGNPIDGNKAIKGKKQYPHERVAPGVMTRKSVSVPLQTGILAIDALVPIGRGQRELIIGDRQTGKTAIALDTIINQKGQDVICIYVGIGQREAKIARVHELLKEHEALDYTIIVSASAANSAALQFLAPYAGVALAEYFMDQGKDVLIVYDDLSKHAVAYREMSLLLRRPPGREAYPGDVFYLHSRLLERACRLNESNGGGSITALPIIETLSGDVSAYIPTNVISITDGQIFLDSTLFYKGIRPAINIGISVSRVGGAAQTKIMKKIAGKIKLELAQYYELEAFAQFASDLEESSKKQLIRGRRIIEVLKQRNLSPFALWQEVLLIYAVVNGYLDSYEPSEINTVTMKLLATAEVSSKKMITAVMEKKELTPEVEDLIKKTLSDLL
jgi:F-type H+-transporting ATPase subunit alpha